MPAPYISERNLLCSLLKHTCKQSLTFVHPGIVTSPFKLFQEAAFVRYLLLSDFKT